MSPGLADPPRPEQWAGYRFHSRARSTGALVVLVDGWEQGLSSPGQGEHGEYRWFLICDEHDLLVSHETQVLARGWMSAPEVWCEGCAKVWESKPKAEGWAG